MANSTDVDRMLARVGLDRASYREFTPNGPDEAAAAAWPLLRSVLAKVNSPLRANGAEMPSGARVEAAGSPLAGALPVFRSADASGTVPAAAVAPFPAAAPPPEARAAAPLPPLMIGAAAGEAPRGRGEGSARPGGSALRSVFARLVGNEAGDESRLTLTSIFRRLG
jgi:hypothetical protein